MLKIIFIATQVAPLFLGGMLFYFDRGIIYNSEPIILQLMYAFLFAGLITLNKTLPALFTRGSKPSKSTKYSWRNLGHVLLTLTALVIFLAALVSLSQRCTRTIFSAIIFSIAIFSAAKSSQDRKLFGQAALLCWLAASLIGAVSVALVTAVLDWRAVLAGCGLASVVTAARLSSWFANWQLESRHAASIRPEQVILVRMLKFFCLMWAVAPSCFAVLVYFKQLPQVALILLAILPLANNVISEARLAEKDFHLTAKFEANSLRLSLLFILAIVIIRVF